MKYAQVVVGLSVSGPFDYIIPQGLYKKIKPGVRVRVDFGRLKLIGYVVGLSEKTRIKRLKSISEAIDDSPILDKKMLLLTKRLSDYYACFWGEAIETALPLSLRKGVVLPQKNTPAQQDAGPGKSGFTLIRDLAGEKRWDIYIKEIRECLLSRASAILIFSDIPAVLKAKNLISERLSIDPLALYRGMKAESRQWLKIKDSAFCVVVGTRSCVFAPAKKLKLIVIDEENDSVYKQDQVPHYHARETALMRAKIEKAKTVLASGLPSLESIYTAKKFKIEPLVFSQEMLLPEVKIADMRRGFIHKKDSILTKYLQDAIVSALESGGKILLFLNRKGFATLSYCHNCGKVLKCPRCDTNLIYHFKEQLLTCHYCNYKMRLPKFCPECNSGYIRYSGFGTEKIESELSRLFPGARIKILNERKEDPLEDADIFIATQFILKENSINFELIGVLSIDNSLNRLDLRAGEKTFALLLGLLKFCGKKMIIQTYMGEHYCFRALEHKDIDLFYKEEIKQRQQLKFPPFSHLAFVKVRGNKESRVKEASQKIFEALSAAAKNSKNISVVNLSKAYPFKLRDNFYWQVLVKSPSVLKMSAFLKKELKGLRHSGIIVTVDVDPV